MVVGSEGLIAIWAFARSRGESFLDAVFAEDVSTSLDGSVFEILSAYSANCESLKSS